LNNQLPQESVLSATSTGSTVSSVTGSLGTATDVLGVLGVVMSADQTGATLKFSQISKLISRLRYVDVNFGQIFGGFLNGLGNAFDKKTSFDASTAFNDKEGEELQETIEHATKRIKLQDKLSNGRKGKFNTYLVDFFLIGKTDKGWMDRLLVEDEANKIRESPASDSSSEKRTLVASAVAASTAKPIPSGFIFGQFLEELKYWIYLVSWLNKIIVMKLVGHRKETGEITPGFFSYVTFSQKIHFVLFNLVSIDVVFLGTRTILHTKISRSIGFLYLWTMVVYNLVILDLLEIGYLSATLVYSTYKQIQKATGKEVLAQEDEKKQALDKKHDDSIHSLKNHEVSKESFARENLAKTGGLRKWFRDEDVCETGGLIKPDQAQKLGYIRVVDSFRTMSFLSMNLAVIEHATGEIKPNEKVFDFKTVMMSNFAFILRVILYHIFIVALANQPGMLIVSLILLESFYIYMIVKNFLILRYLVSVHLFVAKVVQSFFMLIFHLISLIMFLSNGPTSAVQPSASLQNISMWCLIISIVLEYAFLIINIIWIVRTLLQARKKAQEFASKSKGSNPFVVYKWVSKNAYQQDKTVLCRDPFSDIIAKPSETKKKKKVKSKLKDGNEVEDISQYSEGKKAKTNKVIVQKQKKVSDSEDRLPEISKASKTPSKSREVSKDKKLKSKAKKIGDALALAPKKGKTSQVNIVRKASKDEVPDVERELKKGPSKLKSRN